MVKNKREIGYVSEDGRTKRKPRHIISHEEATDIVKKRLSIFWCLALVVVGVLVITPGHVSALTPQEKLDKTIGNIQTFMIGIGIALGGIMIVLAGTKWMTTRGHPEEQSRVKHWLFDIGIGLMLIMISTVAIEVAKGLVVH